MPRSAARSPSSRTERTRGGQRRPAVGGGGARRRPSRWPIPPGVGKLYVDAVHEGDKATPETAHLFGSAEPRICTPPLRPLTPETTIGYDVIEFSREILGIELVPWQKSFFIRGLELLPDGSLRFRTLVLLVARQNGKSTVAQILTLYVMIVLRWPLVLGTAQDLETAESLWEEVVDLFDQDPESDTYNPELAPLVCKVVRVNGKKALHLLVRGKRVVYKVKAANRRAGRGLRGNLILLDELREHQTFDAWGAVTKTTMAQRDALILCMSNAGDVTSRVLRYLRLKAHEALGDPDGIVAAAGGVAGPTQLDLDGLDEELAAPDEIDAALDDTEAADEAMSVEDLEVDRLGFFEWSAPPGCSLRDRSAWRLANPSMNYTGLTSRNIAAAITTDPEEVVRTEVLCQWLEAAKTGPFASGSWDATTVKLVRGPDGVERVDEADRIVGPVKAAIAQSKDRSFTYIAVAGRRPDGLAQVEIAVGRHGDDWVQGWLTSPDRRGRITAVTGQMKGAPESTLMRALQGDPEFTAQIPVVPLTGQDLLDAHAQAYDKVRDGKVRHLPQPVLDIAANTAEKRILGGGVWVIDVARSPVDVAALRAWIAALWLLDAHVQEAPPPAPPPVAVDRETLDDAGARDLTSDLATIGF